MHSEGRNPEWAYRTKEGDNPAAYLTYKELLAGRYGYLSAELGTQVLVRSGVGHRIRLEPQGAGENGWFVFDPSGIEVLERYVQSGGQLLGRLSPPELVTAIGGEILVSLNKVARMLYPNRIRDVRMTSLKGTLDDSSIIEPHRPRWIQVIVGGTKCAYYREVEIERLSEQYDFGFRGSRHMLSVRPKTTLVPIKELHLTTDSAIDTIGSQQ